MPRALPPTIDSGTSVLYNENMYLFERLVKTVRDWFKRKPPQNFTLSVDTLRSLQFLAEYEQRTPEEIADQIIVDVLRGQEAQEGNWQRWNSLSPREQEIAALVCLNYTSRQVAAKLHISPETVKTHVEHILMKFGVPDRNTLRVVLSNWDFSGWDR
jgi:DNA-binding CsgD family transcriptional regulator